MRSSTVVLLALFSAGSAAADPPSEPRPHGRPPASAARGGPSAGAMPSGMPSAMRARGDQRPELGEQARARMERMHERFKGARERHERVRKLTDEISVNLRKPDANPEELKKKLTEFAALREERRHQHRFGLRQRWGQSLGKAEVKAELERHASRLARLQRLEIVAATERKGEPRKRLIDRIGKLRTLEMARHEQAMKGMVPDAPPAPEPATTVGSVPAGSAPSAAVAPVPAASGVTP